MAVHGDYANHAWLDVDVVPIAQMNLSSAPDISHPGFLEIKK
jgi:hypothetical protein